MADVTFASNLQRYYDCEDFSDITLEFSGRQIKAHKIILSTGSEYFKAAFSGNFKESQCSPYRLRGDGEQALVHLIQHLYGYKWQFPDLRLATQQGIDFADVYVDAYIAGQKYLLPTFRDIGEHHLDEVLGNLPGHALHAEILAHVVRYVYVTHKAAAADLRQILVNQFTMHVGSVSDEPKWKVLLRDVPDFGDEVMDRLMAEKAERKFGIMGRVPASASLAARRVLQCIDQAPQTNEGLHAQDIASRLGMEQAEVVRGGQEMEHLGFLYTTLDDHTWAVLDE